MSRTPIDRPGEIEFDAADTVDRLVHIGFDVAEATGPFSADRIDVQWPVRWGRAHRIDVSEAMDRSARIGFDPQWPVQ